MINQLQEIHKNLQQKKKCAPTNPIEEEEECPHEEVDENYYCMGCGEHVQTYEMEHDSRDMER